MDFYFGADVDAASRLVEEDDAVRAPHPACEQELLLVAARERPRFDLGVRRLDVELGEQPGDREDKAGHPFVGPAGRVLDDALREAGLDRTTLYVTNAVKHFKYRQRGKARIHQKPDRSEVLACRHWLDLELAAIRPELLVLLGATAAQALLGSGFRVSRDRGRPMTSEFAPQVVATIHPSAVGKAP